MKKNKSDIFLNERVSASAGAGKTYALTNRFIALAFRERTEGSKFDPTSITALTFTKKAAGEFLSNILKRLAKAATSDVDFEKLVSEITKISKLENESAFDIKKEDVCALLAACVKNLNRLHLSTIDSFFSSALRAFSSESGIFKKLGIISESKYALVESKIMDSMLDEYSKDEVTFNYFYQVIKDTSYGNDDSQLGGTLENTIKGAHSKFLEFPNLKKWGDIKKIIDCNVPEWDEESFQKDLSQLEQNLAEKGIIDSASSILKFLKESTPFTFPSDKCSPILTIIDAIKNNRLDENLPLRSRTKFVLDSQNLKLFASLLMRLYYNHVKVSCKKAYAVGEIVATFERKYNELVRANGELRFDDIPLLLNSLDEFDVNMLEYRLDNQTKHWLIDEFQDTSRQQWLFLKKLIDNVVYENGEKTFYYVGDVKQSIYSWRGGDKDLFDEVYNSYNASGETFIWDGAELANSYRSGRAIIDFVNEVFTRKSLDNVENEYTVNSDLYEVFNPAAIDSFGSIFKRHTTKIENAYVQLSYVEKCKKESGSASEDDSPQNDVQIEKICDEIFKIIKETKPLERGKTCAILVLKNETEGKVIEYLREHLSGTGISVAGEMKRKLVDENLLVPTFLQTLKYVVHPSDTAAFEFVKMSPLRNLVSASDFRAKSLSKISEGGLCGFLSEFKTEIFNYYKSQNKNIPTRESEIFAKLFEACREFDESGLSGIENAIKFLSEKEYDLTGTSNVIQVMTIHKSKGLGFDMVILPDIYKLKYRERKGLSYLVEGNQRQGLYYPMKGFYANINDKFESISSSNKQREDFENLCKMYVALTRSKTAMYLVMPNFEDSKKLSNEGMFFNAVNRVKNCEELESDDSTMRYSIGNKAWYEDSSKGKNDESINKTQSIEKIENPKFVEKIERVKSASKLADKTVEFNAESAEFGSAVHKAFELVKLDKTQVAESVKRAVNSANLKESLKGEVERILAKNLSKDEIAQYFVADENEEIRNELEFDVMQEGKLARGIVDKIKIKRNASSVIEKITIIDFKRSGNFLEERAIQLRAYRNAMIKLFKVESSQIELKIIDYSDAKIYNIL